jgi:DNA-binding HxlR family transcriptional regulator
MLLVRELVLGSERFNDLRRGLPRMSPSLLSKRLHELVRAGVVEKHVEGTEVRYRLTPAGEELRAVVEAVGAWGARWIGEIGERDLDPKLLLWDMHRNVDLGRVPERRTVLHFRFPDVRGPRSRWWLVLSPTEVDVCDDDPEHDVDLTVTTSLRTLTDVWLGRLSWRAALASGDLVVAGQERLRRAMPEWFALSSFAGVTRAEPVVRV